MVAAYLDPGQVAALRGEVADVLGADGLWCGPGAASTRCRDALVQVVTSGGVGAVVIDAVGFDDPGQARAACLRAVVADADEAGVDQCCWCAMTPKPGRTPPGPGRWPGWPGPPPPWGARTPTPLPNR